MCRGRGATLLVYSGREGGIVSMMKWLTFILGLLLVVVLALGCNVRAKLKMCNETTITGNLVPAVAEESE